MEKYEDFVKRNQCWDSYYTYSGIYNRPNCKYSDPMRENYAIAKKICKKFYSKYDKGSAIPQVGDIVEFSDGYEIFKHGLIVEHFNGGLNKFNLLNVCENGSTWTNGECFSTSGGSFHTMHASRFALAGWGERSMWTWGCNGAGANQGIYFNVKVRKWIIPYGELKPLTHVYIYGKNTKDWNGYKRRYAVAVQSGLSGTFGESFKSIHAFLAWAKYVGFEYEKVNRLTDRRGLQNLRRVLITNPNQVPEGAKPLKMAENGSIVDAWTKKIGNTIYFYVPNINYWLNGTFGEIPKMSRDEEFQVWLKYNDNPLGV